MAAAVAALFGATFFAHLGPTLRVEGEGVGDGGGGGGGGGGDGASMTVLGRGFQKKANFHFRGRRDTHTQGSWTRGNDPPLCPFFEATPGAAPGPPV